jgi:hypothetical protein
VRAGLSSGAWLAQPAPGAHGAQAKATGALVAKTEAVPHPILAELTGG